MDELKLIVASDIIIIVIWVENMANDTDI